MERLNSALFRPKKDQCDLCMSYEHSHINEAEYQAHQQRKHEAGQQKETDKQEAINNPEHILAITIDMQTVKLAPLLKCTSVYFKKKTSCPQLYFVRLKKQKRILFLVG
ncbi:hypothetical protein QE152_g6138 [Popillia japonica]|uniref:Uncharacterized protein n=1 Tax=Popillia japonica TaxID=7064 RepID=A0AAW1MFY4_POPJA